MAGKEEGAGADEYCTLVGRTTDLGSRIRRSLFFLCENSTNLPEVLVHLISNNVLTQRESEVIENERSNYDRFRQLFTVLIPRLVHGENSQHFVNAFKQTRNEHILKELKSAVVTKGFSPLPPETSSLGVRFDVREPVPSFFSRENFLRDLHQHILQNHHMDARVTTTSTIISRIAVVTGLGGIGKTETMRKYIHSYGHFYQHVVWIDAEEQNTAENQFRRLALELQLPHKDIENKANDFDILLKDIYDRLCTSNTLLVLDNAEALHDTDPKRPGVARFLPKCLQPTHLAPVVLITSRQLEWPDLHPMPLPLWTQQESTAFIFRQLNLEESAANAKDALTLSDIFGGLPLALQAAAAVICQQSKRNKLMGKGVYTIQHLLSDYQQGKREVLKTHPPGSPDATPLMFLWKVSLDKIREQLNSHFATQILNVMAHLSPTNIPKELLFFIFNSEDSDSLVDAVTLLVDYSFVHDFRTHFSIHRMLQDVTIAHLEASTEKQPEEGELLLIHPLTRITTELMKYWPTVSKSSEAYDAVHDNLVHVTMSHALLQCFKAKHNTALILLKQGKVDEANEMLCHVLDSQEHLLGSSHQDTLNTKDNVAEVLDEQGNHAEALKLYEEVLQLKTKHFGPMHPYTLRTNNKIGWLHLKMRNFEKAESIAKEVLAARQETLPSDHPSVKDTEALYERARLRNNP